MTRFLVLFSKSKMGLILISNRKDKCATPVPLRVSFKKEKNTKKNLKVTKKNFAI